jgi:hypothetical protein
VNTHHGAKVMLKSREDFFDGNVNNLSQEGTMRNAATFYDNIIRGDY